MSNQKIDEIRDKLDNLSYMEQATQAVAKTLLKQVDKAKIAIDDVREAFRDI